MLAPRRRQSPLLGLEQFVEIVLEAVVEPAAGQIAELMVLLLVRGMIGASSQRRKTASWWLQCCYKEMKLNSCCLRTHFQIFLADPMMGP